MTKFKYQEAFAEELAAKWVADDREYVRTTIRNLKNTAQAAYIASFVALWLQENGHNVLAFVSFIHPNNQ